MASVISLVDEIEIPFSVGSLNEFRRWSTSPEFPQRGRIDFLNGRIEVDMSPEAYYSHGKLKGEIARVLLGLCKTNRLGDVQIDQTRIVNVAANLSAEPDIVFVSKETLRTGRVKLVPRSNDDDEYVEVQGTPDMVVEVVSQSSVTKDTKRLFRAYYEAGIPEYWLADGRGAKLVFRIYRHGKSGYVATKADAAGYLNSQVFAKKFRLSRSRPTPGSWDYELQMR